VAFERLESLDHEAVRRYLKLAHRQQVLVPEHRADRFTLLRSLLELIAARRSGEFERVMVLGREILSLQITTGALTSGMADDEAIRSVALLNLGAAELWTGNLDSAEGHLGQSADLAEHTGLGLLQLEGLSLLALLHVARGRLRAAHRTGQVAVDLAAAHGWSGDHQAGAAHLALASVSLERNDLEDATRHIASALISCATAPWRPVMLGVAVVRAWLCCARGDPAMGHAVIDATRQELAGWNPSPPSWMRDWVTVTEAGLYTVDGDTDRAETMLQGLVADNAAHGATSTPRAVALARLQLVADDATGAAQTLAPRLNGSTATGSPGPLIAAWMLNAVAARQLGDDNVASQSLERALALAEPEGFRQVFVDGGPVVRALMSSHLERATSHRSFLGDLLSSTSTEAHAVAGPIESLSDRENVVLRYLPSRLSAAEIADELYLSVHTVKSHLRNLYRKLQASNRREAVDRAREMNLL
jgi:LuxR family maltose regulon positive regulatory protein